MMVKRRIKQAGAFVLAAALTFSAMALPKVYAAKTDDVKKNYVDTAKECSVEITLLKTDYKELNGEVATCPVTVHLYKVADIQESGAYETVSGLKDKAPDFSQVDANTNAADWEGWAAETKAAVAEAGTEATATVTTENGKATVTELETGLYLVDAQKVNSDNYQYEFTPYLISLPNNYYSPEEGITDDDWVYDLTGTHAIKLKPERSERFGDLVITKELDSFNESFGPVTFVFQVEAYKADVDNPDAEKAHVYSNVIAFEFDGTGKKSVTIQDIPAGAEVTVTEIYSGASYMVTSDAVQTTVIVADKEDGSTADDVATVGFVNTYIDSMRGGYGVVNNFSHDGSQWIWTRQSDSTEDEIKATEPVEDNSEESNPVENNSEESNPVEDNSEENNPENDIPQGDTPVDGNPTADNQEAE